MNFFWILGLFDLLKPLAQVSQPSEVICRCFCFVEVPGATRAESVWGAALGCVQPLNMKWRSFLKVFSVLSPFLQLFLPIKAFSPWISSGSFLGHHDHFSAWAVWGLYSSIFGDSKSYFYFFRPSESIGRGFKTIRGFLHLEFLQRSSKSH